MSLRCLIIEDEQPAQRVLKKYIDDVPALQLVDTFTSAVQALEVLREDDVDVLFLDINLPKISGLNFLRSLNDPPQVIITTAYPDFAHEGFELNVVDYLLKPFSFERFVKAVSKITPVAPAKAPEETESNRSYVFIKMDKTLQKIDFESILFLESDRDYVKVKMERESFTHLQTLKYWESLLPEDQFCRVHKSYIVNISHVHKIVGNRLEIGSEVLPIGRHYKQDFLDKIETIS